MAVIKIPDGKGGWVKMPTVTVKGEPGRDAEVTRRNIEEALGYEVPSKADILEGSVVGSEGHMDLRVWNDKLEYWDGNVWVELETGSGTGSGGGGDEEDIGAPAKPELDIRTSDTIVLVEVEGQEYKRGFGDWQSSGVFSDLSLITEYTFYTRIARTETSPASPISEGAVYATGKAEQAPPLPPSTAKKVEKVFVSGEKDTEVRVNDGPWFDSPHTFEGLDYETNYSAYARRKETDIYLPSKPSDPRYFTTINPPEDKTIAPGSKRLLGGDMEAGYFGQVPVEDLFTGTELAEEIGITEGEVRYDDIGWLKFASNGKIIFKSQKPYRHGISWDHIDLAGATDGTKTVIKNGVTYKVRLMKGLHENDPTSYEGESCHGSEWNRLMLPIHERARTQSWGYPDNVDSPTEDWGIRFTDNDLRLSGGGQWCQEVDPTNTGRRVNRGSPSDVTDSNSYSSTSSRRSVGVARFVYYGWSPVLEVIT